MLRIDTDPSFPILLLSPIKIQMDLSLFNLINSSEMNANPVWFIP